MRAHANSGCSEKSIVAAESIVAGLEGAGRESEVPGATGKAKRVRKVLRVRHVGKSVLQASKKLYLKRRG